MEGQIRRIIAVLHKKPFAAEMLSIRTCHKNRVRLTPIIDIIIVIPVLQLHIAGIVQIHLSVLDICASGIDAAAVEGLIRIDRRALIFPVEHISARIMPPKLHAAFRVKRGVLEKCMEYASELTQSVGIVQPADRRHQVKLLPEASLFDSSSFCRLSQFSQIIRQCTHNTISIILPPARISPGSAFSTLPNWSALVRITIVVAG